MTDVFAERLRHPCWVFRVGANAPFPAPYQYSVTVETREFEERPGELWAVPVGFDHPKVSRSDFADTIRTINQVTGNLVAYERAGPPPIRVFQIDPGLIEGRIAMAAHKSHSHVPSPEDALDAHGKIKPATLAADAAQANEMFANGRETMLDVKRLVFHDGSVMDCFHHIATDALPQS